MAVFDGVGVNDPGAARPGRDALVDELRALALLALDRLEPVLARMRDDPRDGSAPGACPLCAARAAVGAEHPGPSGGWAAQAATLVTVLREALGPAGADAPDAGPAGSPDPTRFVQHVPVERTAPPRTVQHVRVDRPPRVAAGHGPVAGAAPC